MPSIFEERTRPHQLLTAALWTLGAATCLVAAAIAGLTLLMALSLDVGDAITSGPEAWIATLVAASQAVGIVAASLLGMSLWHTRRFKIPALALILSAAGITAWLGLHFVGEYT